MVIAGRSTDTALALAPMVHRFGWRTDDFDKLAAGTIAGHIIECGAQCTGGNCQVDWQNIPGHGEHRLPDRGSRARRQLSSSPSTPRPAGASTLDSVKEQLLYELGDPKNYITPDCVADFTSIRLADDGPDRVRVSGIRGGPRPPTLKLSISYANGWKAIGTLVYSLAAGAGEGAGRRRASCAQRLRSLGLEFDEIYTEYLRRQRLPRRRGAAQSPTRRKCSCASACAARTRRPSTASRAS